MGSLRQSRAQLPPLAVGLGVQHRASPTAASPPHSWQGTPALGASLGVTDPPPQLQPLQDLRKNSPQ